MLRAFASGGAALTGVEAISDGVPAFQKPEWVNAQKTLTAMVVILAITFSGITFLANRIAIVPGVAEGGHDAETVVSQIARGVFGDSPMYYAVQYSTFLILFLAANTAYSDFPRLAYFLGRDRFLPHQFTFRGDRLAFSVGIVVLGIASSIVLWAFGGSISRLIPLYAFGVFSAFTLSQAGMVVRWWRRRGAGDAAAAVERIEVAGPIADHRVAVPRTGGTTAGVHRRYARAASGQSPDGDFAGDGAGALVGAGAPQSDGVAVEGGTVVP